MSNVMRLPALLLLACAAVPTAALAEYPDHAITYIMPFNAGGSGEVGIRTWAPFMEKCLGNDAQIIVLATPGAGGVLGFSALAKAAPDGYTMGQLTTPGHVTAGLSMNVPYTMDNFEYIGNVVGVSSVVAVRKDSSYNTLDDFLKAARDSSTPMNVGVGAFGNDDHLAGLEFMLRTGLKLNLVPFGDNALSRNALLGGHVDVVMMSNNEVALYRDQIKPLAIASTERNQLVPEVPTFKELGFDLIAGTSHVIGAPKGIPQEVSQKWQDCLASITKDPEFLASASKRSVPLKVMGAKETLDYVIAQKKKYAAFYKDNPW